MKKQTILAFLLAILTFCCCIPAVCATGYDGYPQELSRVIDGAELLYASEEATLAVHLDEIRARQNMDIVVVTVYSTGGYSPMAYADDFFDYNGYGCGANRDGILLLIAMDSRDWWISTSGYGITALTDAGIDYIGDRIVGDLSAGDYADAFHTFADLCDSFITQAKNGQPFDVYNLPKEPLDMSVVVMISLVAGLVIALIYTGILKGQLHSVQRKPAASEYIRGGSLQLHQSQDLFLYRNVRKTVRQSSSGSGGGGSSVHHSSSGRSHGGGGGRF